MAVPLPLPRPPVCPASAVGCPSLDGSRGPAPLLSRGGQRAYPLADSEVGRTVRRRTGVRVCLRQWARGRAPRRRGAPSPPSSQTGKAAPACGNCILGAIWSVVARHDELFTQVFARRRGVGVRLDNAGYCMVALNAW